MEFFEKKIFCISVQHMKFNCFVDLMIFRGKLHLHQSQLQTQGLIRSLVSSHPLSNILTNFCTFLFSFLKRGKWSLTVIRIYDRFYVNMMQRVKKLASAKIIIAWISFCQLKSCSIRIRATFTKITHTFEKESKKKKWPQFLCNREFYTKQKFSKSISNYFFFLIEYLTTFSRIFQKYFRSNFFSNFFLSFLFLFLLWCIFS